MLQNLQFLSTHILFCLQRDFNMLQNTHFGACLSLFIIQKNKQNIFAAIINYAL